MNQLANKKPDMVIQQSSLLANIPLANDEMSAGVAASFPMLGIKGGKWHYRWKGNDDIISDERGFAVPAINVVILKSQKELSRTFYPPGSYVEGANNRPVCYSSDGVRPDDSVPEPINPVCATCPNSAWGSGATPAAPRAQACQQRRRVVVTPYSDDLTNAEQGGAVLLSVPPSSLRNQDEYAAMLTDNGAQYFGCVTQLNFDQNPALAFPRIEFSWAQPLNDDEVRTVLAMRDSEQVGRILGSKINVDGPEVVDGAAPAAPTAGSGSLGSGHLRAGTSPSEGGIPPTPSTASSRRQRISRCSGEGTGGPTTGCAGGFRSATGGSAQGATKMNLGAPKAAPAQAQAPAPAKAKIGGFAIKPGAAKLPEATSDIADAISAPAAPPPSTRTVKAAPTPEPTAGEAIREDRAEGNLPDQLTAEFGDLMNS